MVSHAIVYTKKETIEKKRKKGGLIESVLKRWSAYIQS